MVMNLANEEWVLDKGAYVCSDMSIELDVLRNKAITGLMGGEGFFQTLVRGSGQVVIQAPGPLQYIDLHNDRLAVDGRFAVARQAHLNYSVQRAAKSLLGSLTSGEGLLNIIEGTGRVWLAPVPNIYVNLVNEVASRMPMPTK
jgi:uncharacterized protein (AIM24 family)